MNFSLIDSASEEIVKIINKRIMSDIWKDFRKSSCNNWRKIHGLPMIRWRKIK